MKNIRKKKEVKEKVYQYFKGTLKTTATTECWKCGERLSSRNKVCSKCGAENEDYRKPGMVIRS